MTEPKRSLVAGISSLAEAGALFAGDVAGLEVVIQGVHCTRTETKEILHDSENKVLIFLTISNVSVCVFARF